MMLLILVDADVAAIGRLVRATMEVISGWEMQRLRTPLPIRPVEPVRMTFIVFEVVDGGEKWRSG